jgi:hypothetical protein
MGVSWLRDDSHCRDGILAGDSIAWDWRAFFIIQLPNGPMDLRSLQCSSYEFAKKEKENKDIFKITYSRHTEWTE